MDKQMTILKSLVEQYSKELDIILTEKQKENIALTIRENLWGNKNKSQVKAVHRNIKLSDDYKITPFKEYVNRYIKEEVQQ